MSRELRNRILITIGLLLVVQALSLIPIPGIDLYMLQKMYGSYQNLSLFEQLNRFSISTLGISPYLGASIIVMTIFYLLNFRTKLDEKKYRLHFYTIIITCLIAFLQAYGLSEFYLHFKPIANDIQLVTNPGFLFRIGIFVSLVGTTFLVIWIAHIISNRGIGNGILLIIGLTLLKKWVNPFITLLKKVYLQFSDKLYHLFIVFDLLILIPIVVILILATWRFEIYNHRFKDSLAIKFPFLLLGIFPIYFAPNIIFSFTSLLKLRIGFDLFSPIMLFIQAILIICIGLLFTLVVYQPKRLHQLKERFLPGSFSNINDSTDQLDVRLIRIFVPYMFLLLVIWAASLFLQSWLGEILKYYYLNPITNLINLFIIIAIVIDLYFQIKVHREMYSGLFVFNKDSDPLFCDHCNAVVDENDEFCKNCGVTFSDEVKCSNHPEKSADYHCSVCSKILCADCAILVNSRYRCENHQHVEIREGWTKVHVANTFVEAQFVQELFKCHNITSKIFSNTMGSNYGAIRLWQLTPVIPFMVARWLGGGEIKIFVPAEDYERSSKLLVERLLDSFNINDLPN